MSDAVEVSLRISAALDYANTGDPDKIRPQYLWLVENITHHVGLEDLTTQELVTLAALLAPAHARFLNGRGTTDDSPPTGGKVLRFVRSSTA
jgi:hypothetical protein